MWPISFITTNWKLTVVGVVAVALVASGYKIGVWQMEESNRLALIAQEKSLIAKCDADKHITQDAQNALQKNFNDISAKRDRLKRLHSSTCVIVSTTNQAYNTCTKTGCSGTHGTTTDAFRDYGADYKECQSTVEVLSKFIDDTWTANGY